MSLKLADIVDFYSERGANGLSGGITLAEVYKNNGNIPVYSAASTGEIAYYNKSNYTLKENSFIFTLNGEWAGSVLISNLYKDVWISNDTGVVEIKKEFVEKYGKINIAIYLDYFFKANRHNNGARPKFSIKRCLSMNIDIEQLEKIKEFDKSMVVSKIEKIKEVSYIAKRIPDKFREDNPEENRIPFRNFIEYYIERGKRLTWGKDLYPNRGKYPAYSAETTGPMGYYNKYNNEVDKDCLIYTIDGEAGSILIPESNKIFLTDHAGVIKVKEEYVNKYGIHAIAVYLDIFFKSNLDVLDGRKQFLIKKILSKQIDIKKIEYLKDVEKLFGSS